MGNRACLDAYVATRDGLEARCPRCRAAPVRSRYIGDPATRLGYVVLWCPACLRGSYISRAEIPTDVQLVSIHDSEAAKEGVPEVSFDED